MAEWKYWPGWAGNHDQRIDDATCSHCGFKHPIVKGDPNKLSDYCPGCGKVMQKRPRAVGLVLSKRCSSCTFVTTMETRDYKYCPLCGENLYTQVE